MNEEIRETRFENGLTVLTDRMAGVRSATLGFFYRVGSRNEPDELNGISHFIEHTVFKGTERRSAMEIAIEQDRLGGNLDAFTTHEETGFAIKVIDNQLPAAFDLLADLLSNPRFDATDLENEQRVIIEEMKMMEDSPEEHLSDLFHREFFPGHPLGLSIAGTPETVRTFNGEATRSYFKTAYRPANLVITAAGNIDHDRFVEMVAETALCSSEANEREKDPIPPTPAAPIIISKRPDLEQAHMIIAAPFPDARSKERYAADLLANIIGGGTSSRLWQKVREERGLAYSVGASALMFFDSGIFSVFAGTSPEQVEEVLDIVLDELRWIVRNGISPDELELMKDQTRASILLGLEDSAGRAGTLAHMEMVHGRQIPVEETLAAIDAVTAEAVGELAREHFTTEKIAFAALGDLDKLDIGRERLTIR
ncbi:MAG TPA: pitrilysin family protein [Pyrinomonadaceae bacterium]|mgnify:CR=1 FL=1|nr:pitrilysin family protein [Pyrinomonadaceae bacterium]HMP64323.1 pitrilysin family protein [Pyrinomonadaceae bacterium]